MSQDIIVTLEETQPDIVVTVSDSSPSDVNVVVSETGFPGPPGSPGSPGLNGTNGTNGTNGLNGVNGSNGLDGAGTYSAIFNFASSISPWVIVHNQDSYDLNVEVFDNNDQRLVVNFQYLDGNSIAIEWYYPMTGYARVFN